ncbi:MAG TPA: hypothetical protein VMX13_17230 [Sedimentisphaerales bacterium]|nr:hypothetical protein [Sedimentisphaerales bacterium]
MKIRNCYKFGLVVLACSVGFCQRAATGDEQALGRPFLTETELKKVRDHLRAGLKWPSRQDILDHKVITDAKAREELRTILSQCLQPRWFDPNTAFDANDPNALDVISLSKWPSVQVPIMELTQFRKHGHTFHISRNIHHDVTYIAVKRDDGGDIWDMTKDHASFLSFLGETIEKFFIRKNLQPWKAKGCHYVPPKEGTDGFFYVYTPDVENHIWTAYMWTNGKVVELELVSLLAKGKIVIGKDYRWIENPIIVGVALFLVIGFLSVLLLMIIKKN